MKKMLRFFDSELNNYDEEFSDYWKFCLPVIASVRILVFAYSIVEPEGRPRARRVILTEVFFNRELI